MVTWWQVLLAGLAGPGLLGTVLGVLAGYRLGRRDRAEDARWTAAQAAQDLRGHCLMPPRPAAPSGPLSHAGLAELLELGEQTLTWPRVPAAERQHLTREPP